MQLLHCAAETGDTESDVSFINLHDSGRSPNRIGNANDVKFLAARQLEPCTAKSELGTLQFGKSQEAAVEGAGLFEIGDSDLEMWNAVAAICVSMIYAPKPGWFWETHLATNRGARWNDGDTISRSETFLRGSVDRQCETAAYIRAQMGHSRIHVTFDTYGRLFPGRCQEASDRFEKSMEIARKKAEADVSNPLATDGDRTCKPEVGNWFLSLWLGAANVNRRAISANEARLAVSNLLAILGEEEANQRLKEPI
jgi:hypothetical protein